MDELSAVAREGGFEDWNETQLEKVAKCLKKLNKENHRIQPGLKWGHAAKVLSIFLRDLEEHSRYFSDAEAKKIRLVLNVPV